ncbi:aldehyde dehydrogenase family protein [Fictibacillus sp. BK138]|uniref:aldehyde dehydrogenase family protein n=1 Tax=Fictibacillus sp. BK138 TaxID=2512121 RepID=UPI0010DA8A96|nr:aldehyde dehydrogenase family protein [Fictibacillus sp. BK138]RZT15587.1 acyl-CoA reductase-like NAD-dependent aldehyde dehydrogenase [Fictibacillus sp. BK138]
MHTSRIFCFGNFVNGRWQRSINDGINVYNKYTNLGIGMVANASGPEVDAAVTSAYDAFNRKELDSLQRFEILMNAAEIVKKRKEEIVELLVSEVGKVYKDAAAETDRGIQTLIASAEETKRISGSGVPMVQPGYQPNVAFTVRVPVGVIAAITPFNFPLNLALHKIGPAIAAGNTVLLKPSEKAPLTACMLAEIFQQAGLPEGHLNIINGTGEVGRFLLADERINMFSFTGSPEVGRLIKNGSGIRKVTLELGGNAPNIIHDDVTDLERAVKLCMKNSFSNSGQACISVQRIYVQNRIYQEFIEKASAEVSSLIVGDPMHDHTDIGPMISEEAAKRVESWVDEAVDSGATVLIGGRREGAFYYPTILTDADASMKVVCEEVFGPVVTIIPYETIDDAFGMANDSRFGLQVGVFTSNLEIFRRATTELNFGGININNVSSYRSDVMPYGGIKDSGLGKEGPRYAIQEMTDKRLIVIH